MATIRMSEAELARDLSSALAKVRQGDELVIEADHREIAIIKPPKPAGRMISEVVADLRARGATVRMDEDFARDIEEGIKAHRKPWNPPSWD
jgi:hypothetical protein